MRPPPLLALHIAVLLFGTAGLFGKWIALPPTTIVFGRVVVASVALAALVRRWRVGAGAGGTGATTAGTGVANDRTQAEPAARGPASTAPLSPAVGFGLGLLLAVHWVTFFQAIQVSSVAVGLLTFATFPVFTALLEPLLPGEGFDGEALIAAAVSLAGIGLVVGRPDLADRVTQGAIWGVASGVTFAVLSLANRRVVGRVGPLRLALHQDAWAAVALLPALLLLDVGRPTGTDLALLLLLGTVFTAGAHGLFLLGLTGVRAARAAVVSTLEPVYGVALAALLLGERPEARTLIGGAIVLAAAAWVSRPAARARSPGSRPP